ncbi:MAG: PAS domain-containing protein [Planctomycetes bacterium]|nr:PAS domain-containing protein [Planctomycetota bacterium]
MGSGPAAVPGGGTGSGVVGRHRRGADQGRILAANELAASVHGYTPEELLRLRVTDLDVPEDAARVPERMRELLARGEARFAVHHRRKDGSVFPVEVSAKLGVVGGRRCAVSFNRDVSVEVQTKQVLQEGRLRLSMAAKAGNIGFWDWDLQTNAVYYSPEWKAQIGHAEDEVSPHYREWESRVHPEDLPGALAAVRAHLDGQTLGLDFEFRLRHKDGSYRHIHARGQLSRDLAGRPIRMLGCHVDITAARQAAAHRAEFDRRVEQMQRLEAIGTLSGGIAHDFNNILTVISGHTQLALGQTSAGDDLRDSLTEIVKASDRARMLVRQILTFGRRQDPQRTPVRLQDVVAEAISFLRATIPAAVCFHVDLPEDLPPVLGDPTQLHQVLVNLATNSWHALDGRGGNICFQAAGIRVAPGDAGRALGVAAGSYVCLTVEDDGRGMDEATRSRIFEPFFTTKPVGQGTGLGLSVVHGTVQSHGGSIAVTSQPGHGTAVRMLLPAATTAPQRNRPRPEPARGHGQRVLLVDDEPEILKVVGRLLQAHGYQVTATSQAREARQMVAADPGRFAMVLTDHEMPGTTGLELAVALRALAPALQVVLCSGYLRPEVVAAAACHGIAGVLAKPVEIDELANLVPLYVAGA